jgi:predicted dehydrogenase
MAARIKIGIVGNGYIGNVHAGIYARDPRVELAAFYDIIAERSQALSARVGGNPCESQDELLGLCDAVCVCAPNRTHRSIATAAVEAGKHVFCEKPFSIGVEDAAGLLETAQAGNKVFQVGHNRRFAPVSSRSKRNC